jgi:S-DNA-T family DNA segregation ATPase FtsK/SpoIIIE
MKKKGKKVNLDYILANVMIIFLMLFFTFFLFIGLMDFIGKYKLGFKWVYINVQKEVYKRFLIRYIFLELIYFISLITFIVWLLFNKKAQINKKLVKFIRNNNYIIYETINNKKKVKDKVDIYFDYKKKEDFLIVRIFPNGSNFDRNLKDTAREKLEDLFGTSISSMKMDYNLLEFEFSFNDNDRLNSIDYIDEGIKLDKKRTWYYNSVPHGLIAGTTGSGKTYFLNYLICNLLYQKCDITFVDPKFADVKSLGEMINPLKTACDENNICRVVREFRESMEARQKLIAGLKGTNVTYKNCGLNAEFLIFDELSAFKSGVEKKDNAKQVENDLKKIILMGRSTGNFVILVAQQPNADIIETGIRDQLGLKVTFGNTKEELRRMLFGSDVKLHILDTRVKGVGYMSLSNSEPYKFYACDLGSDFDYVKEIKKLIKS